MPYYLTAERERIDISEFDGDVKVVYEGMRQDYETDRYHENPPVEKASDQTTHFSAW